MSLRPAAGPHTVYLSYIAVGVGATLLMLAAIPIVCYVGPLRVEWSVIWATFGVVAAGATVVLLLPWQRLVTQRAGQFALYGWSLLDVGAVGAVIAATGGDASWFWILFVLTTVFFSAGYPFPGQLLLLAVTLVTYGAGVTAAGSPVIATVNVWRAAVLVAAFVLASFPSLELRRQAEEHDQVRWETDRLAARLEQRETWWRSLIEHAADPVVVLDDAYQVVFVSPAFGALFGYTLDEALRHRLTEAVDTNDIEHVAQAAAAAGEGRPPITTVCRVRRKDGEWRHVEATFAGLAAMATAAAGVPEGSVVVNLHDVTKRVEAEAALSHQATHDPLTGLSNSRAFYRSLEVSLAAAKRRDEPVALLLVDVDRFKEANDTFGHAFGDQLLVAIARRLETTLRGADVIARLGGDEFTAVLTTGADPAGATAAGRRLWEALGAQMVVADRPLRLKVSVGVACFPDHGHDPDELLRCADHAMYRAKRSGSGVALFQADPAPGAVA